MTFICSTSVYGVADRDYLTTGHGSAHDNTMETNADYDTTNYLETNATITARINQDASVPALVGDVDGDAIPEVVYDDGDGLHVLQYNQDTSNWVEEYTVGTVFIHTAITLFDGDNDGREEIYFCGNTTTNVNSTFMAYEVESGAISLKWSHQVADDVLAPDTNPGMGCVPQKNTGTADASATNTVYAPVCTTLQNGTNVCLFVGVCDEPECPQRFFPYLGVYRFDAENGAELKHDLINDPIAEIRDLGAVDAAIYGYGQQGEVINGDRKHIFTPVCNFDSSDDEQELIFIAVADTPGGPDYDTFMFVIDIETMTKNNNFDGDGVLNINSDVDDFQSSPSCFDNGDGGGYEIFYANELPAGQIQIVRTKSDGSESGLVGSSLTSIDQVSNLFFGEFNDDIGGVIDVGVFSRDTGTNDVEFTAVETDTFITDPVNFDMGAFTENLRPCVSTTEASEAEEGPSNMAGDLNGDLAMTYGLFKSNPGGENLSLATFSYYQDSICPSFADVNADGFTDILLMDGSSIRLLVANSSAINELPNLIRVIPDVRGRTMCSGNQSFLIESPTTGYTDEESNNVRIHYRCNATASFTDTNFTGYGANFTIQCPYNASGGATSIVARLCLQDNIHPSDVTECINIETIVSDGEGCEDPDGIYDAADVVVDDPDSGVLDGETVIIQDIGNSIEIFYGYFGAEDQGDRDFVSFVFILLIFIILAAGIPHHGWLAGLICSVLFSAIFSFTSVSDGGTLLNPIYLMITIAIGLITLFLIAPTIRRSGD